MPIASLPLIARLRTSPHMWAIVLLLFVMKLGLASTFDNHEPIEHLTNSEQVKHLEGDETNFSTTAESDATNPQKHASGACPDYNCHNITAMLPSAQGITIYISQSNYFPSAIYFKQVALQPDFRPPII